MTVRDRHVTLCSMPTLLQRLVLDEITLCRRPAVPGADVRVVKSADTPTPETMNAITKLFASLRAATAVGKSDEEKQSIDAAFGEAELALSKELAGKPPTDEIPAPNAAVQKQLDEIADLRKSLEADKAAVTKSMADMAALQKSIEDREEATAVAKAESDAREMLGSVSGDVKLLGALLRKSTPDERAALEASYKSADTIAKSGAPVLRFGQKARVLKTGESTLESVAKELREADPKLTEAAAIVKAGQMHPALYEAEVLANRQAASAAGV